jgi:hypothetical protein
MGRVLCSRKCRSIADGLMQNAVQYAPQKVSYAAKVRSMVFFKQGFVYT